MNDRQIQDFDSSMAQSANITGLNNAWQEALHLSTLLKYPKNAIIPHSKQPGIYYLTKGRVMLSYTSSAGQERIALYYNVDSLFNEARAFSGYNPDGRFTCLSDVEVHLFSTELILSQNFICSYPHLIQNLLKTMGAKILLHYSFLADMGTGTHAAHLCRLILSLSRKHNGALIFPSQMTQQEVADLFGVHRTTIARTIRYLCDIGVIGQFTYRQVSIINCTLLRQFAEQ